MPSKVNATATDVVPDAATEQTEIKDTKAANLKMVITEKKTSQQIISAENKKVKSCEGNRQTPKQTIETTPALSANVRNKFQPQPDAYVIYPPYQSYSTPTINTIPVPGATTTLPGQQQVLQCQPQFSPPYQVTYHPTMISCDANPVVPNEQSYQVNYEFMNQPLQTCADMQFCQFGWPYHSPSLMSPHQPYPDPWQRFNQFQQTGVIPTLKTPYGYTRFQEVPTDPAKQNFGSKSHYQSDPNSSSFTCQKGLEYSFNCDCQAQPARSVSMAPKQTEKTNRANIPSISVESASANQTRSARSGSTDVTKRQACTNDLKNSDTTQSVSMLSSSTRSTETGGSREWHNRENHLSSDSGCISDNCSSKEDGELVDDVASSSPTVKEINNLFPHSLCLETCTSSSADESYQESQTSSQCPSTSDDNELQHTPTKKHPQQPRVMKAIPSRFVNLLQAAAENAAVQKKRLEGYPLFRQMLYRRYEDHQQDQVYGPEIQQLEFSVANQPNQSTSWYFPGGYVQWQYHQSPFGYMHGQYPQGFGTYVQGGYHQGGSGGYSQGQYQQSPVGYMQNSYNQGSESYAQNHYSQGNGTHSQSQYNQGGSGYVQAPGSYTCADQQFGQEYCHAAPAVPVYVIQVDQPDVANSGTVYNDKRSYTGCSSQGVNEKHPHGYTHLSISSD